MPEDLFVVGFETWTSSRSTDGLPLATEIFGECKLSCLLIPFMLTFELGSLVTLDSQLLPWTRSEPKTGNRWRAIANGARVYAFPIWLYCDDTSGNLSKKWNKHNSFLFTPAGLPRAHVHKEYNVHFLCTSNLAPPLEMLDGIVDELECVFTLYSTAELLTQYAGKAGKQAYGHGTMYINNAYL